MNNRLLFPSTSRTVWLFSDFLFKEILVCRQRIKTCSLLKHFNCIRNFEFPTIWPLFFLGNRMWCLPLFLINEFLLYVVGTFHRKLVIDTTSPNQFIWAVGDNCNSPSPHKWPSPFLFFFYFFYPPFLILLTTLSLSDSCKPPIISLSFSLSNRLYIYVYIILSFYFYFLINENLTLSKKEKIRTLELLIYIYTNI